MTIVVTVLMDLMRGIVVSCVCLSVCLSMPVVYVIHMHVCFNYVISLTSYLSSLLSRKSYILHDDVTMVANSLLLKTAYSVIM